MTTTEDRYDRIRAALEGLGRSTRPTTVIETMPIVGGTTSYVVETLRRDDQAIVLLQIVDGEGRARVVLPDKVAAAIVAQRARLFDRSTPASRARDKRRRELTKKRATDHAKGRHEGKPVQACAACKGAAA